MENLLGLLVVVGSFIIWITQSVTQAKKRAHQEFEDALGEAESGKDPAKPLIEALPAPPPRPERPPRPQPQGAPSWKDLQRQLEEMLREPPLTPTATQPEAPKPQRKKAPKGGARPQRSFEAPRPSDRVPSPPLAPRLERVQPAMAQAQATVARVSAAPSQAVSAIHQAPKVRFPHLHPNPVANAILLAEVLKPYTRRRGRPFGMEGPGR